jgi:hypothetical protein
MDRRKAFIRIYGFVLPLPRALLLLLCHFTFGEEGKTKGYGILIVLSYQT